MGSKEKRYSAPDSYSVIPRGDWFVFFDQHCFTYVRVNEHGKAILEAVGSETSAEEVSHAVASKFGFEPSDIETQVSSFLENMISTGFLHEGPYQYPTEKTDGRKVKPSMLYLHPTFRCNLNCLYCYNKEDRKHSDTDELTAEEWFAVLDQAKDLGVRSVIFTGGEPLIRKDTFEIAKYAKSLDLANQLLTNALLLNEKNVEEIIETFDSVGLSLDSHIREKNDFHRGRGAWDAVIRAVKLLKERNHPFSIKAVVTKYNVEDIPDFYRFFLEEFNFGRINAGLYVPTSKEDTILLPDLEDYRRAVAAANEIVEEFYGEDKLSILRFHGVPMKQNQCGAASGEFGIAPDGSVFPCQALLKDEFKAGNVREKSLSDIFYNSPIMIEVRNTTVDKIENCRDCDIKGICAGGCRSLAYNLYGEIGSHNAYCCDFLKDVAQNVLWKASCVPIEELKGLIEENKAKQEAELKTS